jgi:hypothetical protein
LGKGALEVKKYLIVYDLERRGEDYEPLLNALRKIGALHPLYSKWVLRTDYTAVQIRDYLKQFIDAGDLLLVVGLTGEAAWTKLFITNEEFKQAIA